MSRYGFQSMALSRALAGVTFLCLGCSDSPSAPASASRASLAVGARSALHDVPFKGDGTGQDISVTFEATGVHIVAAVTGNATGLGRFTEVLDYVLAYDFVNFAGDGTMVAADGSKLFLTFTGTIPGFPAQVFPLAYSANFTITGGTGRLAGSSGTGTIAGTDFGGGRFEFSFNGSRTPP